MKTTLLIPTVLALTLSLSAVSSIAAPNLNLLGETAPAATAVRTITITPDTRYVNVQDGQAVNFDVGGKTFTWAFNGPVASFDLNRVAPPGLLDHVVTAYVAPDPLYRR